MVLHFKGLHFKSVLYQYMCSYLPLYYKMKDRWKMLITSLVFTSILALIFLFLGVSMRMVPLRDYGVLLYTYFQTVDPTQQVRINGNYLVGLDHAFLSYPRGIIKHSFVAEVLSNDKAIFSIEGLFLGRLIPS